jgi:hypothetical protein
MAIILDPTPSDGANLEDAAFEKVMQSSEFMNQAVDGVPELDEDTEDTSTDESEELDDVETDDENDEAID